MTELEKNNQIKKEYDRISVYFQNLRESEISVISPLIQNAAFMRVALDDLQEIIAREGPIEKYRNGQHQFGTKQSASLQSYNSLIKNYAAVIKTLFGLLPPEKRPQHHEEKETVEERKARLDKYQEDFCAMLQRDREAGIIP